MPLSLANLTADAQRMFADFVQTVTFSRPGRTSYSVSAAIDMAGGGDVLTDDGGARLSTSYATVTVLAADCAWTPDKGDRVRIDGDSTAWRVSTVRATPSDPCVTLGLEAWV